MGDKYNYEALWQKIGIFIGVVILPVLFIVLSLVFSGSTRTCSFGVYCSLCDAYDRLCVC